MQLSKQPQAFGSQGTLATAWGSGKAELQVFTRELQGQLNDVFAVTFPEDFDGWHKVWSASDFLVEENTIFSWVGSSQLKTRKTSPSPFSLTMRHGPLTCNQRVGLCRVLRVAFSKPFFACSILFFGVDRIMASVRRNFYV